MNGTDIAQVIGAVCVGIPIVGGFVMQVLTFNRQNARDARLTEIASKVDGLTSASVAMGLRAGTAEGELIGAAKAAAGADKVPIPVVVIADEPIPVVESSGKPLK